MPGDGDGLASGCKRTCFWLTLLWAPLLTFSVVGYLGGVVPIAGVILPLLLTIGFGGFTCVSVFSSGMLAEDMAKGDGSVVGMMQRASTQSISGGGGSGLNLGATNTGGSSNPPARIVGAAVGAPDAGVGFRVASAQDYNPEPSDAFGRWQVEMESGHWVDFDEGQQQTFTTALAHGLAKSEFNVKGQRYELDFGAMVQRNHRTSKERKVRCKQPGESDEPHPKGPTVGGKPLFAGSPGDWDAALKGSAATPANPTSSSSPGAEWQVQMDSGNWIDMDAVSCQIVNDALGRGDAAAFFRSHNQDYELNFTAGTQKNKKTGKERPVRTKRTGAPTKTPMPQGDTPPPGTGGDESLAQGSHVQM